MTDLELAEEIEWVYAEAFVTNEGEQIVGLHSRPLIVEAHRNALAAVIAALRRGPESWDATVLRVKVSQQLETIRELRQKLERTPSGEMVMVKPETLMEMRAALRFYADDNHQVWVTFEPEGRKRVLQRMKDEPGWVETGEDHRGHEEFVETGARAENALKLLTDEENDAIDRAMLSATEAEGRKSCPLCGRTDPHSHTSGPLGMS